MNQLVAKQDTTPVNSIGMSATGTGTKIAPQNLGEVVKFAEVMSRADIALPKHLRGNPGACMAVALQAMEWQLSPFAVAAKSYAVGGAIAYEAQLIAAVVNTRSGIKGRLRYTFSGEGSALTCTVLGILDGEECSYTSPPLGSITTKNSPLWKSDPQQQLGYFSARSWARRHCPEVILGVYDRDEAEEFRGPDRAKDITPAFDPLSDEPTPVGNENSDEWFSGAQTSETDSEVDSGRVLDEAQSGLGVHADEPAEVEASTPASTSALSSPRDILIRYARDILPKAADTNVLPSTLAAIEKRWATDLSKLGPEDKEKAHGISASMRAIVNGKQKLDVVLEHYADVLECTVEALGG